MSLIVDTYKCDLCEDVVSRGETYGILIKNGVLSISSDLDSCDRHICVECDYYLEEMGRKKEYKNKVEEGVYLFSLGLVIGAFIMFVILQIFK